MDNENGKEGISSCGSLSDDTNPPKMGRRKSILTPLKDDPTHILEIIISDDESDDVEVKKEPVVDTNQEKVVERNVKEKKGKKLKVNSSKCHVNHNINREKKRMYCKDCNERICPECFCQFNTNSLYFHLNKLCEPLECVKCGLICPSRCSLKAHERLHELKHPLVCPDCGAIYGSAHYLIQHLQTKCYHLNRTSLFKCKKCQFIANTRKHLALHFMAHMVVVYKCRLCNFHSVEDKGKMRKHSLSRHQIPLNVQGQWLMYSEIMCGICGDSVMNKILHCSNHVTKSRQFEQGWLCPCLISFRSRRDLKKHGKICDKMSFLPQWSMLFENKVHTTLGLLKKTAFLEYKPKLESKPTLECTQTKQFKPQLQCKMCSMDISASAPVSSLCEPCENLQSVNADISVANIAAEEEVGSEDATLPEFSPKEYTPITEDHRDYFKTYINDTDDDVNDVTCTTASNGRSVFTQTVNSFKNQASQCFPMNNFNRYGCPFCSYSVEIHKKTLFLFASHIKLSHPNAVIPIKMSKNPPEPFERVREISDLNPKLSEVLDKTPRKISNLKLVRCRDFANDTESMINNSESHDIKIINAMSLKDSRESSKEKTRRIGDVAKDSRLITRKPEGKRLGVVESTSLIRKGDQVFAKDEVQRKIVKVIRMSDGKCTKSVNDPSQRSLLIKSIDKGGKLCVTSKTTACDLKAQNLLPSTSKSPSRQQVVKMLYPNLSIRLPKKRIAESKKSESNFHSGIQGETSLDSGSNANEKINEHDKENNQEASPELVSVIDAYRKKDPTVSVNEEVKEISVRKEHEVWDEFYETLSIIEKRRKKGGDNLGDIPAAVGSNMSTSYYAKRVVKKPKRLVEDYDKEEEASPPKKAKTNVGSSEKSKERKSHSDEVYLFKKQVKSPKTKNEPSAKSMESSRKRLDLSGVSESSNDMEMKFIQKNFVNDTASDVNYKRKRKLASKLVYLKKINDEHSLDFSSGQVISNKETDSSEKVACAVCKTEFEDAAQLRGHILCHRTEDNMHQCMECGECFVVRPSLEKHLHAYHKIKDITRYIDENNCTDQGKQEQEPKEKLFPDTQCRVCKAEFSTVIEMNKHFRTHGMAFLTEAKKDAKI